MIKPHDYQQRMINESFDKLKDKNSILIQAMTGAGKTVIMAFICKRWIEGKRGKILITCHRKELVDQTVKTLTAIGVSAQSYTASSKHKHAFVDVYVAMIETVNNRLTKNKFNVDGITLVMSDECHIMVHSKVYGFFPHAKIIGFTATPVILKREKFYFCKHCKTESSKLEDCCGDEMEEWTRPFTLSKIYEDIVIGPSFKDLHEIGQLVPEISFVKNYADTSELKVDATGDYTTKSLDNAYGSDNAVFNVVLNYKELCEGKRTIIFNSSTKTNALVYEKLIEAGVNAKMFDSVNESGISRTQLVKWFNDTPDAVLCNVGVFTTGFDSREVEAIIINRATKSLSLFLQMVGRGGRSSLKIFKDSFIFVDGGDNISEFGEWSSDRDWEDIFLNGVGKPRPRKVDIEDVQDCPNCGAMIPKTDMECDFCGHEFEVKEESNKEKQEEISESVLEPIREIPPPSGIHIYNYTKSQGENIHFAWRIMQNRVVDMFRYYRVTKQQYESAKESGELDKKVKKMILKPYFYLSKKEDIQNGSYRTIEYLVNKTKEKVERYYYGR